MSTPPMKPPVNDAPADDAEPEDEGDVAPLEVATLALHVDDRGRMFATRADGTSLQVIARRAFPWSKPDAFISLRTKKGSEVALLETLDAAPAAAGDVIRSFLNATTFVPKIIRVDRVSMEHGYQTWHVATESGELDLRVQEREDVRFLSDSRFSVKDAHGNVYEIADVRTLDERSQQELAKIM